MRGLEFSHKSTIDSLVPDLQRWFRDDIVLSGEVIVVTPMGECTVKWRGPLTGDDGLHWALSHVFAGNFPCTFKAEDDTNQFVAKALETHLYNYGPWEGQLQEDIAEVERIVRDCSSKIGGIKEIRARFGCGLKEAKDLFDTLDAHFKS